MTPVISDSKDLKKKRKEAYRFSKEQPDKVILVPFSMNRDTRVSTLHTERSKRAGESGS